MPSRPRRRKQHAAAIHPRKLLCAADGHLLFTVTDRTRTSLRDSGFEVVVDLLGYYSKNSDQGKYLRDVMRRVDASPKRQVTEHRSLPQRHKLDQRHQPNLGVELATAYESGLTTTDLRVQFSLGQSSVLRLLAGHGVVMRQQGLHEQDLPLAIQLYEDGATLAELGGQFGISPNAVRRALVTAGVVMRPRGGSKPRPAR